MVEVSIRATSAAGSAWQVLTIRVQCRPGLSGGPLPAATVGRFYHFTIGTHGYPRPTVTESGRLPTGLIFKRKYDGTITLSGTPKPGSGGAHPIRITLSNPLGQVTVSYTLMVKGPAA